MKLIIEMLTDVKTNAVGVFLLRLFLLISMASSTSHGVPSQRNVTPIQRTVQLQLSCPYQPAGRDFNYWQKGLLHTTENCHLVVELYDERRVIPSSWLTDGAKHELISDTGRFVIHGGPKKPITPLTQDATLAISVRFFPATNTPVQYPICLAAWFELETSSTPEDMTPLVQWWQSAAAGQNKMLNGAATLPELQRGNDHRVLGATGVVSPEGWSDAWTIDTRKIISPAKITAATFPPVKLTAHVELNVEEPDDLSDEQDPPRPQLRLVPAMGLPN